MSQITARTLRSRQEACQTLLPLLRQHRSFIVSSHARPDGDAVGSALAAMHLLQALGKEVTVAFADPIPTPFTKLPGAERIQVNLPEIVPDVALILECDSVSRTGYKQIPAATTINIDHHHSGSQFADVNWIDPAAPAVGAMLYELAVASGAALTSALASCLYAAVLTDTVSFTLPTTTAATFDLARHLLELGAEAAAISDAVYFSQRESKVKLLGAALRTLQVNRPVAWGTVTWADMCATDASVEDSDGIVQHVIGIEGVQAAALLRELPGGTTLRASLRSKGNVDVARVAEQFGGGGHRNASGCTLPGPLSTAAQQLESALQTACAMGGAGGAP